MINNLGTYDITIDFDKMFTHTTTNIYFKEGDINTSKIRATLVKSGSVIDLTGVTVSVNIETTIDNVTDSATVVDAENGIIEYTFPTNALIEGINFFELILVEGENIKESPKFAYKVLDSIDDAGAVEAENNYPILLQLISDTNVVINNANQAIVNIEDKIIEVEERTVAKETLIDNKIIETNEVIETTILAKDGTILATNNANTKIVEAENKIVDVENRFQALTASQQQDAEVIDMRTGVDGKVYASAKARVDAIETKPSIIYSSVEGPYISTDSIDSWVENVQILGNTYQDPNNLATIKSTGTKLADGRFEIPLLSRGKNNCGSAIELGTFVNGNVSATTVNFRTKDFTKVKGGIAYVASVNNSNLVVQSIIQYDINYVYISTLGSSATLSSNCVYVKIAGRHTTNGTDITSIVSAGVKVQLEEGTAVTSFENYQEHKLTILSDVQIEKVGTVADRIIQANDEIWDTEKNIGTAILNSSENWSIDVSGEMTNTLLFKCTLNSIGSGVISDKFVTGTTGDSERIAIAGTILAVRILKSKLATQDIAGFKAWLSQNNTLVKYQLATPVYYPLPDSQQVALRTFNNKTNILSLCEIEPTIKCDVPKSVGASIGAITNHLDNVDLELEKIKKLEDATNSTVIVDKDFVNISQTSNGYLSDVKLEGRTLNQLVTNGNFVNTTGWIGGGATLSAINNTLSLTSSGLNTYPYVYKDTNGICSSGKKVFVKATIRVTNSNCSSIKVMIGATVSGANKDIMTITNPVQNQYYTVYAIHSITDLVGNIRLYVQNTYVDTATSTGKVMEVQNVMALDLTSLGMTNYSADEINSMLGGYFEGLKSVGQDVNKIVVSSTKGDGNLFDEQVMLSKLTKANYDIVYKDSKRCFYSNNHALNTDIPLFTKFKENTSYTIKFNYYYEHATISGMYFRIVYTDGTYISAPATTVNSWASVTFTSLSTKTIKHIELSYGTSSSKTWIDLDCVIINVGTTPILYKSIETDKKEILYLDTVDSTWKKPVFRGIWSNGVLTVGDVAEKKSDGKYSYRKRMSEVVLNGSESWSLVSTYANTIRYNITKSDVAMNSRIISDKFVEGLAGDDMENIDTHFSQNVIQITLSKTKATDLATFKTWLASNPVTVVYQLATEQIYECTPIDVASYSTETNFTLECGVLSPRSTIRVQNYIGEIINNLKEKVSIQENQNSLMRITLLNHEARLILGGH